MFSDRMIPTDLAAMILSMGEPGGVLAELQGASFVIERLSIYRLGSGGAEVTVSTVLKDGSRYVSEKDLKRAFRELDVPWPSPDWGQ